SLWWFIKSVVRADCRLSEKELYLLLIIKSLEQCMEQCIFMEMLSLSTSDHNASAVDPECFMVYNCFQCHGFMTNNKCRLLLRALSFTYCRLPLQERYS